VHTQRGNYLTTDVMVSCIACLPCSRETLGTRLPLVAAIDGKKRSEKNYEVRDLMPIYSIFPVLG